MVAAPNAEGKSRSLTFEFWSNHEVRSSTAPASTYVRSVPPPQPQMMVGAWPAPMAVLILVLYASFWKVVCLSVLLGLALLKRSTAPVRTPSCGCPLRNQYVAPLLPPPPGPDVPQAESAIESGTLAARPKMARREIWVSIRGAPFYRAA